MNTLGEAQKNIEAPEWARRIDLNGLYQLHQVADDFVTRIQTVPPRWSGELLTGGLLSGLRAPREDDSFEQARRSALADEFKATIGGDPTHVDLAGDGHYRSLIEVFEKQRLDAPPSSELRRHEAFALYLRAVYWAAFRFVCDACIVTMGSRLTPTVEGIRAAQSHCRELLKLGKAGLWERTGYVALHTAAEEFLNANPSARSADRTRHARGGRTQPALMAVKAFENDLSKLFPGIKEREFRNIAGIRFGAFVGRGNPYDSK